MQATHAGSLDAGDLLAVLSSGKTLPELSAGFGAHPTMISTWQSELASEAAGVFGRHRRSEFDVQKIIDDLHRRIGQLTAERDVLSCMPALSKVAGRVRK